MFILRLQIKHQMRMSMKTLILKEIISNPIVISDRYAEAFVKIVYGYYHKRASIAQKLM